MSINVKYNLDFAGNMNQNSSTEMTIVYGQAGAGIRRNPIYRGGRTIASFPPDILYRGRVVPLGRRD